MLDRDLARLYEVETRVLNQAVKRNIERFPDNFMFQLTKEEFEELRPISQIVISVKGGGTQKLPLVFTEQGVAMLSSVLRSKNAIQTKIKKLHSDYPNWNITLYNIAMITKQTFKSLEKRWICL